MTHDLPRVRDVLFATDFSPCSEAAAIVAAAYAKQLGARLHVLHVTMPMTGAKQVSSLKDLAGRIPAEVPVITAVESGDPASQIVRYAGRVGAGLIVLGTHGRTGVSRALLGSVAERVVRTASCPVLAVPVKDRRATRPTTADPVAIARPPRCLVCAVPSEDLICEPCRTRIRGESLERKLETLRQGKS
jgi:nucleotide-binding universal stress UspA family protein